MFSVIIPYYKKRSYIERCLDAVLAQTFTQYEIILVDDGSKDDIIDLIAKRYAGKVLLVQQENQGVSAARNTGIANANGKYIAFLDADDCWSAAYLEYAAQVIHENNEVKIIGSHYTRNWSALERDAQPLNYFRFKNYFKEAIRNTYYTSSSTIISIKFFEQNPGFNSNLKRGEDIDVWLRAVASGGNAFYIKNTLVYYSDEDENQATTTLGNVENSLVGTINHYYQPLLGQKNNSDFSKFVSKYVYFNLYLYFFSLSNREKAKRNLKLNRHYYFFLHLPYYLPFTVGHKIVTNKKLNKYLRLYFKFFLRKIY